MALDRSLVGTSWPPFVVEITETRFAQFRSACDEDLPVLSDEAMASQHGHRSIPAPFGLLTMLAQFTDYSELLVRLGAGQREAVGGEVEYEYMREPCVGDRLTGTTRIADVYERNGRRGTLTCVVLETRWVDAAGDLMVAERNHCVLLPPNMA